MGGPSSPPFPSEPWQTEQRLSKNPAAGIHILRKTGKQSRKTITRIKGHDIRCADPDITVSMLRQAICFALLPLSLLGASEWLLVRRTDGAQVEGKAELPAITIESDGKPLKLKAAEILSIQNGSPASEFESQRIKTDLADIQGTDRAKRDHAVEELTAIGVPALTPLLQTLKDTDQHEPRPLYRLFERIMPSYADGLIAHWTSFAFRMEERFAASFLTLRCS